MTIRRLKVDCLKDNHVCTNDTNNDKSNDNDDNDKSKKNNELKY